MRCFFCFRGNLRPARISWYAWPLLLVLLRPYRCRDCGHRTFGFFWHAVRRRGDQGPLKPLDMEDPETGEFRTRRS